METLSVWYPCCIRSVRVLAVSYLICPCACILFVRVLAVLCPICQCAYRVLSYLSVCLPCCVRPVSVLAVSYLICPCARLVSDLPVCLPCRILFVCVLVLYPICPCDCHVISNLFMLISWTTVYNIYFMPDAVDWTIAYKDYWRYCGLSYIFRQVVKIAKSDY